MRTYLPASAHCSATLGVLEAAIGGAFESRQRGRRETRPGLRKSMIDGDNDESVARQFLHLIGSLSPLPIPPGL